MKVCNVSGIGEFHARLFSGAETGKLFGALRKVAALENPRLLSEGEETMGGWFPWVDGKDESVAAPAFAAQLA